MSHPEVEKFENYRNELNKTGCGFCLAKWTQVTTHLHLGRTHSCHHPDTHPIPVEEIKRNPSALHNTRFKKQKRKEMLDGKRPSECDYCWKVEDNSNQISDRVYKSHEPWSKPHHKEIREMDWREDYNPKYMEVSFSNKCNFKCSYCGPSFSSSWAQEIEKHGPYPTTDLFNNFDWLKKSGRMPIHHKDYNPYVEAFWKWWPDLYRDLDTFRITGGEPLLSKDTWGVLDYIIDEENPNTNLNISINTNLGVPDKLIDKLIEKIKRIEDEGRVKSFVIYTSVDGWGEQAEYARTGLEFNRFWDNLNKILTNCPTVTVGIMSTYNALSLSTYNKLIKEVYGLKMEYGSPDRAWSTAVSLDCSFLRHPEHQTVRVVPLSFSDLVKSHGELAETLTTFPHNFDQEIWGFTQMEIPKFHRVYDWMVSPQDEKELLKNQHNFYKFFNAHDERRGTNFLKTFPEYEEFYNYCKGITF